MEAQQPAFSRQRWAGHLLRLHPGLLQPSSDPIRAWRLPTASKPAPARNTWSRRILRCAVTICLFMDLSCREHLMSICCLRSSSLLRMPLASVLQIQRHSRLGEKSFHRDASTPSTPTLLTFKLHLVQPKPSLHSPLLSQTAS